ncbi:hypothetical protein [Elstera cyanobacteriorum]|uniref:hypothetical protein n=1 Tax=Elstera cyanobacteriorum TaxID=2022747 RepID=UPI002355BEF5|nr:hypothetical protein [Elstera cyanobacteriorum]MCK6444413.1 hypothetical protein [Elstera cyanobacteriorum]
MSLLNDGKLAKTIASALKNVMYPITIARTTPGEYIPGGGIEDEGTTTTYTAKGMVDSFSPTELSLGLVQPTDRKVTLLAQGLPITPDPMTDKIAAEGRELTVISVTSDPAKATWELVCR